MATFEWERFIFSASVVPKSGPGTLLSDGPFLDELVARSTGIQCFMVSGDVYSIRVLFISVAYIYARVQFPVPYVLT